MHSKTWWAALFLILLSPPAGAACEGKGTKFFFGNGMFTSRQEARKSSLALQKLTQNNLALDAGKKQFFQVAYNQDEDVFSQLLEVFEQKELEDYETFWLWVGSLRPAPDWFRQKALSYAAQLSRTGNFFDETGAHLELYEQALHEGFQIILVSHAQGNLFANQVIPLLEDSTRYRNYDLPWRTEKHANSPLPEFKEVFANIQVATPASRTVDNSPWTTYAGDLVMNFVRVTGRALPANIRAGKAVPGQDWLGHGFVRTYLARPDTSAKIISDLRAAYARMKYPLPDDQTAFTIVRSYESRHEHGGATQGIFDIYASGPAGPRVGLKEDRDTEIIKQIHTVSCENLRSGKFDLIGSTWGNPDGLTSIAYEWFDGQWPDAKPAAPAVTFHFDPAEWDQYWRLGSVLVERSPGREPFAFKLDTLTKPVQIPEPNAQARR